MNASEPTAATLRRGAEHPATEQPVARWLKAVADLHEASPCPDGVAGCTCSGCQWCADEDWPCSDTRNALDVARQTLEVTS